MLNPAQLKAIMRRAKLSHLEKITPHLVAAMIEFGITSRTRAAAFLAQVGHESLDLTLTREIWQGSPSQGTAAQHRYDVRENLGNTPERDGDGFFYRGRGWIQTTGKANFRRTGRALSLDLVNHPELLDQPQHAARSAAYFFDSTGCNDLADALNGDGDGADLKQLDKITKRINGGYNGRMDRQARYLRSLRILDEAQFEEFPTPTRRGAIKRAQAKVGIRLPPVAASTQAAPPAEKPASAPEAQTAATTAENSDSLIDAIPVNEQTKAAGQVAARSVGRTLAKPGAWLTAALLAGNVWVWLIVIVVAVGLGYYAFRRRAEIKAFVIRMLRKVKSDS